MKSHQIPETREIFSLIMVLVRVAVTPRRWRKWKTGRYFVSDAFLWYPRKGARIWIGAVPESRPAIAGRPSLRGREWSSAGGTTMGDSPRSEGWPARPRAISGIAFLGFRRKFGFFPRAADVTPSWRRRSQMSRCQVHHVWLTLKALTYFCINHWDQRVFSY